MRDSRPFAMPDPDTLRPDDERASFDAVVARMATMGALVDGKVPGYFGALLNSPEMAYHISALGRLVRNAGNRENSYSHADREWVDQVLSVEWDDNTVLMQHIPDALAVGIRVEAIQALRAGREHELSDDEQLLVGYIRAVVNGCVTADLNDSMTARLGRRGVVEYSIFIMFLALTIRLIQALTGARSRSNAEIDDLLQDFKEGRRTPPTLQEVLNRAG